MHDTIHMPEKPYGHTRIQAAACRQVSCALLYHLYTQTYTQHCYLCGNTGERLGRAWQVSGVQHNARGLGEPEEPTPMFPLKIEPLTITVASTMEIAPPACDHTYAYHRE